MLKPSEITPLRVVAWVVGAMSLLNLVQDVSRFAIAQKLKAWFDAYATLTHAVGDFFFGWINVDWMTVSESEHHVLVLSAIVGTAAFRAEYRHSKQQDPKKMEYSFLIFLPIFYIALSALPAVLLPGFLGLAGSFAGLLVSVHAQSQKVRSDRFAPRHAFFNEVLGVLGVLAVVSAVNYSLVRVDGA